MFKKFFDFKRDAVSSGAFHKNVRFHIQFLFTSSGDVEIIAINTADNEFFSGIMPKDAFDEMIEKYQQGKTA